MNTSILRNTILSVLCGPAFLFHPLVTRAQVPQATPQNPSELFQVAHIWTLHLTFTPAQWDAMEPRGESRGPGGGGPERPGGPGGPGGFGPGNFIAPTFLQKGDSDSDGRLSEVEFHTLAETWFVAWDKEKSGSLKEAQIRDGLNSTLGAPPGGGPGGPGGPRGPGGGPNLQGAEGKRNGLSSAAGIEFDYVHADMEFDGQRFSDVAVRYKGNGTFMGSRGSIKRSLKIDLNEFTKGQKLAGVTTLNLHNSVTDASWMNEVLAYRLYRDAGVPAPRTAYARVYVTVPGKHERRYLGLYSLVENPDKKFAEEVFSAKKGALLKPVSRTLFEDLGDDWSHYNQIYDPKTHLSPEQKQRVIDFCHLVSKASDEAFASKVGEYVDLEEFARYMAVTVWISTLDSILGVGQNFLVYISPDSQKLRFIPWDLDHAFGQFVLVGTQEQREQLSIQHPWNNQVRFLERMFKVESFKKAYLAKLEEFTRTIFQPARFHQQVDELSEILRPSVKEESEEKLGRFNKVVVGESVPPSDFGGGGPGRRPRGPAGDGGNGPPRGFGSPAKPIKAFVTVRAQSVTDQLAGKSKGLELAAGGMFGGPGGPGGFGPGNFLAAAFLRSLDRDKNESINRAEFLDGFDQWFKSWGKGASALTEELLRAGINRDLAPFGPPGGPPPEGDRP